MHEESKTNTIGGSFLYSFLVTVISGLVIVVYPLSIGLAFGPETMGNFSVLFYWSTFLSIPIANGIAPAIARYIAASKKTDFEVYQSIGSKLTLFYILIISIIFPILSFTVFNLEVVEFFIVLPLIFLTITHYLIRYIMQGQEKFKGLLKLELIAFGVFLPFMVLFSILPNVLMWENLSTYYFLLIPIIVFHLTIDLIFIIPKLKEIDFKSLIRFPEITKKILLYSLFIGLGSIFGLGTSQIQIIISELHLDQFEVGVLSFWTSAVVPINIIAVAMGAILLPRITNLRKIDSNLTQKLVNSINWSFSLLIVPIAGLVFLLIGAFPNLLNVITLNKYDMEYYWPIVILLIYHSINYLLSSPTIAYFSTFEKKVMISPIASFIFSLSAILTWTFLVPIVGIYGFTIGIAIGGLLSHITVQATAIIVTKGKIGFHSFFGIFIFGLSALGIYLLGIWNNIWVFVPWAILSAPLIAYGLYKLAKVLTNKDFSQSIDETLLKS